MIFGICGTCYENFISTTAAGVFDGINKKDDRLESSKAFLWIITQ
jgi:hypothetical protein